MNKHKYIYMWIYPSHIHRGSDIHIADRQHMCPLWYKDVGRSIYSNLRYSSEFELLGSKLVVRLFIFAFEHDQHRMICVMLNIFNWTFLLCHLSNIQADYLICIVTICYYFHMLYEYTVTLWKIIGDFTTCSLFSAKTRLDKYRFPLSSGYLEYLKMP